MFDALKCLKLNALYMKTLLTNLLLASIAGGILTLGFAPFNIWLTGFLSPAILFYLWRKSSERQAFLQGLVFGFSLFITSVSWVFISIHRYGGQSIFIASIITILFCFILSLFFAIQGFITRRFLPNSPLRKCFFFAAVWTLFEIVRTYLFTGFPWCFIGYTQLNTPLRWYAPVFGVYGVSFTTVLISSLLTLWCIFIYTKLKKNFIYKQFIKESLTTSSLLLCILIFALSIILGKIPFTHTDKKHPIKLAIIQGNISQSLKWHPGILTDTLLKYQALSAPYFKEHDTLIIWPESAIPTFSQYLTAYLSQLSQMLKQNNNTLLTGILSLSSNTGAYYNTAQVFGKGHGEYQKIHLVPFGEYIPFQTIAGHFFKWLNLPMTGFTAGPSTQHPLVLNHVQVGVVICYEIAYPSLVRQNAKNAHLLITLSDDGWFGNSLGPWQQAQMAEMRALEIGRFIINSSNNAVTNVINPEGEVFKTLPINQATTLATEVYPASGKTPWQQFGLLLDLTVLLLFVILSLISPPLRKRFF